ncbi:dynein axonemal assembly factor 1 homolog [Polyergus mexicanus]|uniref:dynein axonemal assembly factor 1 homolog n=1 Tax=Polyergus mexicanus TaxID=615972 RepID=UPI0038B52E8F
MDTFKRHDNASNDSCDLSFSSLIEDKSEVSVTCKSVSSASGNKIVKDCPAMLEDSDNMTTDLVAKTQSKIKKYENLCGSEKIEATSGVDEDNAPRVSSNYTDHTFDLNHEKPSYCNSSMTSDRDVVFMDDDLEYYDTTIQGEDSEDSEKTIKEDFLLDDRCANSLSKYLSGVDSTYEKICRIKHGGEIFVDSGISLNSTNVKDNNDEIVREIIDDYVDSRITAEKDVPSENVEEEIKDEETRLERSSESCINDMENSLGEKIDVENVAVSNIKSNNYYIDNDERYLKDAVDLLKYTGENETLSIEEDSVERTITEIKEMDKLIKDLLYTNDDEQNDSAEERMVESLSAELESDRDDVMRKIIESCSNVSIDFQHHSPIRENSTPDFEESSSEYSIKKFRGNKLFSHFRDVSDTAVAKEDILKTIREAEKILTDNPYSDTSETSVNENYDRDDSSENFTKEVNNDEECETVNKEEKNFVETKDTKMILANVKNEWNVIDSNLQKLADITCSDRPRSHIEIHETLEKIAEEKRKIEDRKKDSLERLSKKFEEIDKFIADRYDISYTSDKDPCEFKIPQDFANDSDSLDVNFHIDRGNVEVPLTRAELTENLKIEELEKELANEMEEHKKLMDEYQKIIATDLEKIKQATLESESEQIYNDEENDKETANQSRNDENLSDELNPMSGIMTDTTTIEIDSEFDDPFLKDLREPERTYIKGKIYDFDEKKHGVRMTEELIRKHCKEQRLYQTPHLNDILYLHFKGFSFIESLEKYTGLKCLWLESNGIREIANLENQSELKCLFLHHNLISKIENLDYLTKLDTLNLSHNTIRRIENLDGLKFLNNLNLSHNYLRETADIEHLRLLHALSILDISSNKIDTCDVVDILGDVKSLRVVTLTGNPVLKQIKMYRKTMILKCKNLQYLDDRPVFPRDRACAEAWMRGGVDEEMAERNRWIQAEQKKINDSVMALINKRKRCKPVGTSEKEAVDTKKETEEKEEEEEEEEEEEKDEEVAAKSSAHTATRSRGLLDLEKKKKSEGRSFLDSSSSSGEELTSDEENERMRQKGDKESDGRRPMAEEERKVSDENNEELLLPWRAEARGRIQPKRLIEHVSERYIADDNRKSIHDPLDSRIIDGEIADYKKILVTEKEEISNLQKPIDNDNDETNDRKNEKAFTCSVSSDTSDLKQMLEENQKLTGTLTGLRDDISNKNIKSYQRKNQEYPFGSKLSSIREEMREFSDNMDKFVDENKIVFKNGEVKGFWCERKMVDENLQTDSTDDREIQETGTTKVFTSNEDKLQWWNTKERKLKVEEIIRQREDEARKIVVEIKDATSNNPDCSSLEERKRVDTTDNFQDVYDLMTMKTCPPSCLPDSRETYSVKDIENYTRERSAKVSQKESGGIFNSLFTELRNRDIEKMSKTKVSSELMILEEKLDSENPTIDMKQKSIPEIINIIDVVDSAEQSSKCKKIETDENYPKIEDLQDKFNNPKSSEAKKNVDESDDDSFKTATSLVEDSSILESNQGSPKVLKLSNAEDNCNKIIDSSENENVDLNDCCEKMISNKECNDLVCEKKKIIDKIENSSAKIETSNSEQKLSTGTEESNSQMESLVRAIDRLTLGRTNQSSLRLTGKRTREAEDIQVNNKKSFLVKKINSGRKSEERKSRSQISEKCRQHVIQETRKFAKKVSPLIDKCITNLIKDAENVDGKSQYHKYDRRSLGEYLPSGFVSKIDLNKPAGDFGERKNCPVKYDNKSHDVTSVQSGKQQLKQTINSRSANDSASVNDSDIKSLANMLQQSGSIYESESTAINADVSLYKEFCDHLHKLESEKKLLIKSDFTMDREEESKEKLPDDKSVQKKEYPIKKSIKPLIQVISENTAIFKDSKPTLEQKEIKERSHTSQSVLDYCQKKDQVVFGPVEGTIMTSEDSENHINRESAINLTEGMKIEVFSTSRTLGNTECKEECILPKEKRETTTMNMKKSIEMQVAQEN